MKPFPSAVLILGLLVAPPLNAQEQEPADSIPGNHLIENGVERLTVIPGPETFRDNFSGFYFPYTLTVTSVDGVRHPMRATGSGGRKRLFIKIYAAAFYAEDSAYLGPDPRKGLLEQDVARRIVFRFKRTASEERLQEVFDDAIGKLWNGTPPADVVPEMNKFMSYFEGGIPKGQTLEFTYLPDKGLYTEVSGIAKPLISNPLIARRFWELWLGDDQMSVSPSLTKNLVRFLVDDKPAIKVIDPDESR